MRFSFSFSTSVSWLFQFRLCDFTCNDPESFCQNGRIWGGLQVGGEEFPRIKNKLSAEKNKKYTADSE
jgi:hypothetical protein